MNSRPDDDKTLPHRWQDVFDSHAYRCIYCVVTLDEDFRVFHSATEDHLYPRYPKGNPNQGADTKRNLVPACQVCNFLKDDYISPLASTPGVLVQTPRGKWQVAPEHKEAYIREVTTEIRRREVERRKTVRFGTGTPPKDLKQGRLPETFQDGLEEPVCERRVLPEAFGTRPYQSV